MEKTISYLNGKAWYRLLKVIFGLFILIAILIFNGLLIDNGVKKIDNQKTKIYCSYGDKKIFTPDIIGINLSYYDYLAYSVGGYDDYNWKTINKNCGGDVFRRLEPPYNFEIKLIYSYVEFVKYFIIGNLLILFGFEILRRSFYYIVLGSIRPQK